MILYHGTSLESARAIARAGFSAWARDSNWTVSEPNTVYAWSPDMLVKHEEYEDFDDANDGAITRALENAQIAAARAGSLGEYVVAIKLEIDSELVSEDFSCEHMGGAVSFLESEPVKILGCYLAPYSPSLRLFILAQISGHRLFEMPELSYVEEEVIKELNAQKVWIGAVVIDNYEFIKNLP